MMLAVRLTLLASSFVYCLELSYMLIMG